VHSLSLDDCTADIAGCVLHVVLRQHISLPVMALCRCVPLTLMAYANAAQPSNHYWLYFYHTYVLPCHCIAVVQDLKKKPKLREKYGVLDEWVMPFEVIPIIDIPGFGTQAAQVRYGARMGLYVNA
jgi:hypothetical protein